MQVYAGISKEARVYYMDRIKSDIIEFRRVVFIAQPTIQVLLEVL